MKARETGSSPAECRSTASIPGTSLPSGPQPFIEQDCPLEYAELEQRDCLGFPQAARDLVGVVSRLRPPACLAIYGTWGSGKSTMMNAVRTQLLETEPKPMCVSFDAWKYDANTGDEVCFALVRQLDTAIGRAYAKQRRIRPAEVTRAFKGVTKALAAMGALALKYRTMGQVDLLSDLPRALQGFRTMLGKYYSWVDEVDRLPDMFNRMVVEALRGLNVGRLYVFIDDLDRCMPASVVTMMERLKNLLWSGRVIYVLGIDRAAVVDAIKGHYNHSPEYAERYLDKLVTLGFHLPSIAHKSPLVAAMVETAVSNGSDKGYVDRAAKELERASSSLARVNGTNPRIGKRVGRKLGLLLSSLPTLIAEHDRRLGRSLLDVALQGNPQGADANERALGIVLRVSAVVALLRESDAGALGEFDRTLFEAMHQYATAATESADFRRAAGVIAARFGSESEGSGVARLLFHREGLALPVNLYEAIYVRLGPWL